MSINHVSFKGLISFKDNRCKPTIIDTNKIQGWQADTFDSPKYSNCSKGVDVFLSGKTVNIPNITVPEFTEIFKIAGSDNKTYEIIGINSRNKYYWESDAVRQDVDSQIDVSKFGFQRTWKLKEI